MGVAHHAGLIEGEVEDVVEFLESHGEELSNDDLMQMEHEQLNKKTIKLPQSLSTKVCLGF